MRINDKHGKPHEVRIDAGEVTLDGHVVTKFLRTHNTAIMHGFTIPPEIRQRAVGSVLLHTLERWFLDHGVVDVQIVVPDEYDAMHRNFFTKNKYVQRDKRYEKILAMHY